MTAKVYYDADASPERLKDTPIAVIGYGSQGHAHALNLRESGLDVRVGLPVESRSRAKACAAGLRVLSPRDAASEARVVMVLVPDTSQTELFENELRDELSAGKTLMFAHGFNVHFGLINPPAGVDVSMVAPKAPGHRVRELYQEGAGTPALVAVAQDASGEALADALAYARAIGCTRAGVIQTTFAEETETDLFGEQAVLCGGTAALVKAAFETLVDAGYQPEVAYFECLHELKLIVDLMYQGGLNYMRYSVSDTAEYGDYRGGPRIVTEATRRAMREMLGEIRDGSFARQWVSEHRAGRPWFEAARKRDRDHKLEQVGAQLRGMMPFVRPRVVQPDGSVA